MSEGYPRRLGKFEIVRRIGVGGMAEVYEALLHGVEGFRKRLALKTLLPDLKNDREVVDMFIDEATIVSELEHPNIVNVYEFGELDGTYYLAMELVDGWTLRELQHRFAATFPVAAAAFCVREICRALDYIHGTDRQIVHRDVTPQNIFVDRKGAIKLADFGIAKTAARRTRTEAGQIKGKLSYLAPEQVTEEQVTPQTDVYSAGLILFELLTGRRLIDGRREVDIIRAAMAPKLYPPSKIRPEAAPLDRYVLHALQPHPSLRYPSAALFAADLDDFLSWQKPSGAEQAAAAAAAMSPPPSEPKARSRKAAALAPTDELQSVSLVAGTPLLAPVAERALALQAHAPELEQPPADRLQRSYGALIAAVVLLLISSAAIAYALWPTSDDRKPITVVSIDVAPTPSDAAAGSSADHAVDSTVARATPPKRRPGRRRPRKRSKPPRKRKPPDAAPKRPPAPQAPDPAQLQRTLRAVTADAANRGLFKGDDPAYDKQLVVARRAVAGGRPDAEQTLQRLRARVDAFRIDRRFAERKLARLSGAIRKAALPEKKRLAMERSSQQILQLIIGGKYVRASRMMTLARKKLTR